MSIILEELVQPLIDAVKLFFSDMAAYEDIVDFFVNGIFGHAEGSSVGLWQSIVSFFEGLFIFLR